MTASGGSDEPTATAQPLIGEWLEHCDERPPGRVIGQVAREIKAMLDEGIAAERVRSGLAMWQRKGLHPSALASVVHQTSQSSKPDPRIPNEPIEQPPNGLTDDEMRQWWVERKARLEAVRVSR